MNIEGPLSEDDLSAVVGGRRDDLFVPLPIEAPLEPLYPEPLFPPIVICPTEPLPEQV